MAAVGAGLWLLWTFEHEHTDVRAPWTGLTYAASALAFIVAGVMGRGWRAVAAAVAAACIAVMVVEPLVWGTGPARSGLEESCDPGCISPEAAVVLAGTAAAALAALGILLRRALQLARRVLGSAGTAS